MNHLNFRPQGHKIALNWDNVAGLTDWVALVGTDGRRFPPPSDRDGWNDGVTRPLPTGRRFQSGTPVVTLTFPWLSDGQIATLSTYNQENVTIAVHEPGAVGPTDTTHYNAVFNFERSQLRTLQRRANGFEKVTVDLVIVEAL